VNLLFGPWHWHRRLTFPFMPVTSSARSIGGLVNKQLA